MWIICRKQFRCWSVICNMLCRYPNVSHKSNCKCLTQELLAQQRSSVRHCGDIWAMQETKPRGKGEGAGSSEASPYFTLTNFPRLIARFLTCNLNFQLDISVFPAMAGGACNTHLREQTLQQTLRNHERTFLCRISRLVSYLLLYMILIIGLKTKNVASAS